MSIKNLLLKKGGNFKLPFFKNYQKNTIYINESGLYQLIMRSKKPEAKKFQTWVCDEVLPTLRKTGQYNLNQIKWITNEELKVMYDNSQKINYGAPAPDAACCSVIIWIRMFCIFFIIKKIILN